MDKLEKFGAICQVEDKTERLAKIAELHLTALKERKSSLIVTPTHGECRTICGAVREAMKGEGMLSGPEQTVPRLNRLNLTEAQRGGACSKRLRGKVDKPVSPAVVRQRSREQLYSEGKAIPAPG